MLYLVKSVHPLISRLLDQGKYNELTCTCKVTYSQ